MVRNLLGIRATLNNIGSAWLRLGSPTKAMKYFELALSIIKEAYGVRHPRYAQFSIVSARYERDR